MQYRCAFLAAAFGLALAGFFTGSAWAADDPYGDISGLKLNRPADGEDVKIAAPPKGALVLFDGKNLEGWVSRRDPKKEAGWKVLPNGILEVKPGAGDILTAKKFEGKFKLHVEFRVPYMPKASGQGRGNSGVYVQGRYEVQVLDSYGLKSKDNDCGGIYSVAAPLENACKAPTVWQSYDIEYTSVKCSDGKKTEPARITVYQNGVKIHDDVKIPLNKDATTSGMSPGELGGVCTPGPILLQDHGNRVQFRNIWLLQE